MKKLVHVISSLKMGGAEKLLLWLIKELPQYQHHVIYLHDGPIRHALEELILLNKHSTTLFLYQLKGLLRAYDPVGLLNLTRLLTVIKPACILTSLWAANLLGRIAGKLVKTPVVSIAHAHKDHEGFLRNLFDSITPVRPDTLIAVSPSVARSWNTFCKKHAIPLITIPNGICFSNSLVANSQPTTQLNKKFTIGAVGRLVPVKRFNFLLTSFALLLQEYSNAQLVLVGAGPEEQNLRTQAGKLGIEHSVIFTGEKNAHDYYPDFDCFVQTSQHEQLSLVLLEALSYALPVIATVPEDGHLSNHDVITHQITGLLTPASDAHALKDQLLWVINNPLEAKKLGKMGKNLIIEYYTSSRMAQEYRKIIEQNYKIIDELS